MTTERWTGVIECEFQFLADSQSYYEELQELLQEKLIIHYPVTHYDWETGRIYRHCPGTEEQALRRIEIRERVEAAKKRIKKRTDRLLNALYQLNEDEQDILICFYIEQGMSADYIKKLLGFRSINELYEAREKALVKMYRIYTKEREVLHLEYIQMIKEERRSKARLLSERLAKERVHGGNGGRLSKKIFL